MIRARLGLVGLVVCVVVCVVVGLMVVPTAIVSAGPSPTMAVESPAAATARAHRHWSPCIAEINTYRVAAGRRPVTDDAIASAVATAHSAYQAALDSLQHQGPGNDDAGQRLTSAGYTWSIWGENVGAGQRDCADVVRAFMNSPGHRANILGSEFVHAGVSAQVSASGVRYWTVVFAAPG